MKRLHVFILLINLLIFLFIGCEGEKLEPTIEPKPKLYMRGNFGNEYLEFYNYTETLNNYYEFPANPISNRFILLMPKETTIFKSRVIQIDVTRIDIDTLKTPWENYPTPFFPKAYVNLSLIDFGKTNEQFNSTDSINYIGSQLDNDPIYLKINAIIADTIEGIFHGDIKTKTGLLKHITNGEFRVKFSRFTL